MDQDYIWVLGVLLLNSVGIRGVKDSSSGLVYTVEKYVTPGIYYENLYNTQWKTVVSVDLKETNSETDQLGQYIEHVNLCHAPELTLDRLQPFLRNS
jgi:hypothetical protein